MKRAWSKIFKDFGIFMLVFVIVMVPSILLFYNGPNDIKYKDDSFEGFVYEVPEASNSNIIFDQHSHTRFSDGILTVEHNIKWHISHGFNAMVLTDHNTLRNSKQLRDLAVKYAAEFIIIQGMEWTSDRIHMNILGLSEWDLRIPRNPSDSDIQEAIDEAHSQGAVVSVDHFHPSQVESKNHPTFQQLLVWGVDYIEIVNGRTFYSDSEPWCNNSGGFGKITGTDMHSPKDVFCWTLMNTTEFTVDAVMGEIRARNTSVVYNLTGSEDSSIGHNNVWFDILSPFIFIGAMFEMFGYHWVTLPFFLVYLIGSFVIYQAIKFGIQQRKQKKHKSADN